MASFPCNKINLIGIPLKLQKALPMGGSLPAIGDAFLIRDFQSFSESLITNWG